MPRQSQTQSSAPAPGWYMSAEEYSEWMESERAKRRTSEELGNLFGSAPDEVPDQAAVQTSYIPTGKVSEPVLTAYPTTEPGQSYRPGELARKRRASEDTAPGEIGIIPVMGPLITPPKRPVLWLAALAGVLLGATAITIGSIYLVERIREG